MPELKSEIERGHISRPRKVRPSPAQKKLAKLAVSGEFTYNEIADKLSITNSPNPRQVVYKRLQSEGAKIAVENELKRVYDADMLKERLTELLNSKSENIALGSVQLGMRSLGMLIDRVESEQLVITANAEQIKGKDAPTLAQELAHLLKQVGRGARLSLDGGESAPVLESQNELKTPNERQNETKP